MSRCPVAVQHFWCWHSFHCLSCRCCFGQSQDLVLVKSCVQLPLFLSLQPLRARVPNVSCCTTIYVHQCLCMQQHVTVDDRRCTHTSTHVLHPQLAMRHRMNVTLHVNRMNIILHKVTWQATMACPIWSQSERWLQHNCIMSTYTLSPNFVKGQHPGNLTVTSVTHTQCGSGNIGTLCDCHDS
jgi:hypothetical protein